MKTNKAHSHKEIRIGCPQCLEDNRPGHTPGPWTITPDIMRPEIKAGEKTLAYITSTHGTTLDEAESNARLMTTAPELLAFIKLLIAGATGQIPDTHSAMSENYLLEMAKKLVAIAEGGKP